MAAHHHGSNFPRDGRNTRCADNPSIVFLPPASAHAASERGTVRDGRRRKFSEGTSEVLLQISTPLAATADEAWSLITKPSTFEFVTHGLLRLRERSQLPDEWHAGQTIRSPPNSPSVHFSPRPSRERGRG